MKWIGLTGGIATGKTTVKDLLKGLGFSVIDADRISHEITRKGQTGYDRIISQFGSSFVGSNGELDRKKLGELIFNRQDKRWILESLLHPLIRIEVKKQKQQAQEAGAKTCFYDVPLLFEKNLQSQFDQVIVVWCDQATQLQRLVKRNSFTLEQAVARVRAQMQLGEKTFLAHHCIDNSGSENDLIEIVSNLATRL